MSRQKFATSWASALSSLSGVNDLFPWRSLSGGSSEVSMKAIVAAIIAIIVLYLVDQEFAAGHYTDAVNMAIRQLRHSLGI